jgi:hypothetical protein
MFFCLLHKQKIKIEIFFLFNLYKNEIFFDDLKRMILFLIVENIGLKSIKEETLDYG